MRYRIDLAFDGTNYHGWQKQENAGSVQSMLDKCLGTLTGEAIETVGCGRTDTGVHAKFYTAHFETIHDLPSNIEYKLNSILPRDIAVFEVKVAAIDFHARFMATSREYQYFIHTRKDPFLEGKSFYYPKNIDVELMNAGCAILMETSDFASFCKKGADNKTTICKLIDAKWTKDDHQLIFTIRADRFLRNMVRAIVGTLMDLGLKKTSLEELKQIIAATDRQASGTSVPACGLYLTDVVYPE
jgi:tRNA pseudouridine38-40 synthase